MNKKKILLAEDDQFILGMYSEKMRNLGFEVIVAEDGSEAVKLAKERKPDIMLLDIVMPKMDGFEVLKAIKENEELKEIPVILLTNLGQKQSVEKGIKMGAADYIIKAHFTPSEVIDKVEQILKNKNVQTRKSKKT